MSTSETTVHGKLDELTGRAKQAIGETIGNQDLANKGAAQQIKGHAEQAWGSVKETVHDLGAQTTTETTTDSTESAHDVRQSLTSTAQNAKDHIQTALKNVLHKDHENHKSN